MIAGQLLWLTGKLFSYLFLGALAGYGGASLVAALSSRLPLQNLVSLTAGALIFLMGLRVLGLVPVGSKATGGIMESVLAALGRNLLSTPAPGAALALGLATGFLPCPIVLAFLAYAVQSGSVATGMLTMSALGLGTALPLLLLGGACRLSGMHLRRWAPRAGGIILILLGATTALRGTGLYHRLLGCPSGIALHQVAAQAQKPCCTGELHGNGNGN
jgi:sulfite exporter TauE/SafE